MRLETRRLVLRPLAVEDATWIFELMADPQVMAHWDIGEIDDPDLVARIVAGQVESAAAGKAFYWAIERREGGAPIGCCDLSEIDRWHHRAEIGFMLRQDAWGQGYAGEAIQEVIAFADREGVKRLWARNHVGNVASDSLLLRLGFEEEGMLRGHVLRDGERRDCRLYGLLL